MDLIDAFVPTMLSLVYASAFIGAALLAVRFSPNDRASDRHCVLVTGVLAAAGCLLAAAGLRAVSPGGSGEASGVLGMVWSAVLAGGTLVFVGVHTVGGLLLGARAIRARDPSPRLNALIGRCADEMRLLSTPSVAISDSCRSPYVTLYAGGTIVLPPEFEGYGHSVQRGVLMHEMAHLRRGDCLTQLLVQLAGAALWWNPLYWVAMRRIALERELACDAAVLNEHHDPAWYADLLVRLARAGRSIATVAFAATPMAQSSTLTLRLRALRQISGRFTPMDAVLSPMSRMEMLCWVVGLFCFITVCEALGRVMIEELSRDPRFFASVSMFFGG